VGERAKGGDYAQKKVFLRDLSRGGKEEPVEGKNCDGAFG